MVDFCVLRALCILLKGSIFYLLGKLVYNIFVVAHLCHLPRPEKLMYQYRQTSCLFCTHCCMIYNIHMATEICRFEACGTGAFIWPILFSILNPKIFLALVSYRCTLPSFLDVHDSVGLCQLCDFGFKA